MSKNDLVKLLEYWKKLAAKNQKRNPGIISDADKMVEFLKKQILLSLDSAA